MSQAGSTLIHVPYWWDLSQNRFVSERGERREERGERRGERGERERGEERRVLTLK